MELDSEYSEEEKEYRNKIKMANFIYYFAFLIACQSSFGEGTVNLLIPMHETEKLIGEFYLVIIIFSRILTYTMHISLLYL